MYKIRLLCILVGAVFVMSCQEKKGETVRDSTAQVITSSSSPALSINYAKGFQIDYREGYKVVTILPARSVKDEKVASYILLPRDKELPVDAPKGTIIEVPVRKMVAMSSMHVGMLELLGATEVLVGVDHLPYIYSEKVHQLAQEGKIVEVGQNMSPNLERIIALQPDLVMGTGNSGPSPLHQVQEAGISVMLNSEWMEETPLAKAEWMKLVGALLNKDDEADAIFTGIEQEYNRLVNLVLTEKDKPLVLTGMNLKDVWYMPNKGNYMTQFLLDAGAEYLYGKNEGSGSSALTFESVYPMAMEATVWVNLGSVNIQNKKDLLLLDKRYGDFKSYQQGSIFDYTKRINKVGANDFWESAGVRPDKVLADLVRIFHPSLLPEHELYYYQSIE